MPKCEMCGKKIREYKMFSPKGLLDMIYVCKECHEQGRAAEWGEVSAVNYFTKQIDINKATEKGKKCIDKCLSNAKETIEKKMETNKIQREEKKEEDFHSEDIIVTSTDTIVGIKSMIYLPMLISQRIITNNSNTDPSDVIADMIDELRRHCYREYKKTVGFNAIVGLRINTLNDAQANILIIMYGTPVIFAGDDWTDDDWDEDEDDDDDSEDVDEIDEETDEER